MNHHHTLHRHASRGKLIVRVSSVAMGLAAAVGLQFVGDEPMPAMQVSATAAPCPGGAASATAAL